jgi:hypothetical protein
MQIFYSFATEVEDRASLCLEQAKHAERFHKQAIGFLVMIEESASLV